MHVVAYAAELLGGIGILLIGTWLATSGLGIALGRRLGAGRAGTPESSLACLLRGLGSSVLLGANGTLPAGAGSLARHAGMSPERTTMLVIGSSFGAASIALMSYFTSLGWLPYAVALLVLAIAAGAHALHSRWTPWGEAAAGFSLVVIGLGVLSHGWTGIAPWMRLPTLDQRPVLIPVWIAMGLGLGLLVRSPGAAAALFVQGAATHALDVLTVSAALIGVVASAGGASFAGLRTGTASERSVFAVHGVFVLAALGLASWIFAWGYRLPSMLVQMPGGPAAAITLTLIVLLGAAAGLVALFQQPLHRLFSSKLAPRNTGSALARDLSGGCASIPGLALGGLGAAVDGAADAARDLVHKELSGNGTTERRRQEARAAAVRSVEEIDGFRSGLEGIRWPGEAIEAVLQAARSARLWAQVVDILEELSKTKMPSGDEALKLRFVRMRFGAMYRVEGVDEDGGLVSAADLAEERELFERELLGLRDATVAACVAGSVRAENLSSISRHLDLLSALVRTALEAVECRERVEDVSFRFLPELPEDVELIDYEEEWEDEIAASEEEEPAEEELFEKSSPAGALPRKRAFQLPSRR